MTLPGMSGEKFSGGSVVTGKVTGYIRFDDFIFNQSHP
jgi:hypothetical protein